MRTFACRLNTAFVVSLLSTFSGVLSAAPQFTNATLNGSNLILQGSGGVTYGAYNLVISTNIVLPRAQWTAVATNYFDSNGFFTLTNSLNLSMSQQFYALQIPDLWIPAWGAWLGAEVTNGATQDFTSEETRIGRQLDILRIYQPSPWTNLTSEESTYINAGRKLLISYYPSSPWSNAVGVANGGSAAVDAQMAQLAKSVAGIAPKKIMINVWPEPEANVVGGLTTNTNNLYGTTNQYVVMWQNVRNIFDANGATNVIWVWIIENYEPAQYVLSGLWPGNAYVDWIGWDIYQGSASQNYISTQTQAYNFMVSNSSAKNNYLSKPWAWSEWGVGNNGWYPTVGEQTNTFKAVNAAMNSYQFPRIKYVAYFDIDAPSAPNASSAILPGAQSVYNAFASSPYMFQEAP